MAAQIYKALTPIPDTAVDCKEFYLQYLKLQIPQFAQYDSEFLWFTVPEAEIQTQLQEVNNSFTCESAKKIIEESLDFQPSWLVKSRDPSINENPIDTKVAWVNNKTGDSFVCIDNTEDQNVWIGMKTGKLIRPVPPADKFDFFGDNSTILFAPLSGDAKDTGGLYDGKDFNIKWEPVFDHSVASSARNGTIKFKNLPIDATTEVVTITGWLYWNGTNAVMAFGWDRYDVWVESGNFGFNTFHSDLHGFDFKDYKNKWVYSAIVFYKDQPGRIFINGSEQALTQKRGSFGADNAKLSNQLSVFGSNIGSGYRKFGWIGRVRIFNRELTPEEVGQLTYAEVEMITKVGGEV